MRNKLGLVSVLLLLSLLLSSSPVQSKVSPFIQFQSPPVPQQTSPLTLEQEWQAKQLPWDKMPLCPPVIGDADTKGPPNFDKPACRVPNNGPSVSWEPGTAPPAGFVPASKMAIPNDSTPLDNATPIIVPSPTITTIKSSSIHSTSAFSWASNILVCNSCTPSAHVQSVYWTSSTNIPSLTCCLKSWWNYHYAARTHIASLLRPNACWAGNWGNMALGLGYGQLGPQSGGVKIFWENYSGFGSCSQYWDTQYTFPTNTSIYFRMEETIEGGLYYWSGYAWVGGVWHQFFHYYAQTYINLIDIGLELEANNGDKSSVLVPLSFAHKATLTILNSSNLPWDNSALPAYMQGSSLYTTDWPWGVLDISATNFTSVAAETTYQ